MGFGKDKKEASTNATKIAHLEDCLEDWKQRFDDMLNGCVMKIVDKTDALDSNFKAIEERLAILELEAKKNREYVENNITNRIQNIEEKMNQSEKTLDLMMTTGARKDLEKKLDTIKVDCEFSNEDKELLMSNVEGVKQNLVLIEDDMKKVEHNLLMTNMKLGKKYESIRKTTENNFKAFENQSQKVVDKVDSIQSLVDGIKGDLECNVKLDVQMLKSILTNSQCKIESTKAQMRNVQDNLEKMKDDANSLRSVVETVHDKMDKEEQKCYCTVCNKLFKDCFEDHLMDK